MPREFAVYSQSPEKENEEGLTLASGNNNDVVIGDATLQRITGPGGAFTITGIAGGVAGRQVILFNSTAQNMTIANESASSAAANRINMLTGFDYVSTGQGSVLLVYSAAESRWLMLAQVT